MLDVLLAPFFNHLGKRLALPLDGGLASANSIEHSPRLCAGLLDGQAVGRSDAAPNLRPLRIAADDPVRLEATRFDPDPVASQFWIAFGPARLSRLELFDGFVGHLAGHGLTSKS